MNLMTLENVSKSYTERMLFDSVSLGIGEGDKIGVIGINGTGKSTLLKIIAGLEEPDSGSVTRGRNLRTAYLSQAPLFDDSLNVLENVVRGLKAEEEYRNLEGEARAMLVKLGISDTGVNPAVLSGGQRKRAALVRTLLIPSDLCVLDEPTNHLDSGMTEWLEEYLGKYRGAFVMVTHDRYFLDKVTNRIVELDKGNLYSYQTNYSGFLERKAEREEAAMATERKAKSLYKTELEWMQRGARARTTKQRAHIERFEALRDRDKVVQDDTVDITALSSRMGKKTVELCSVAKSFGDKTVIQDFSYILLPMDRIGIIGPNGCGKTTLLKILTGLMEPDSGTVETGTTIKIGYFSQENEYLDESLTVIEYVRGTAEYLETSEGTVSASQMCETFLFAPSLQYAKIAKLSGGEKRRLYLLKVLMDAPNILVLDEPTNDLDIQTLTILENYLEGFPGIVVAVSHDRYFLDKMAARIFAYGADGAIRRYEGNYEDYKTACQAREKETEAALTAKKQEAGAKPGGEEGRDAWKQRDEKLKFTYKEQQEYDTIDEDIESLERRIAALVEEMAAEAATDHRGAFVKLNSLMEEKAEAEKCLEEKMERWIYLNDLAERIASQK